MNPRRAFTLIELLVVVAIIGILAALLFPALNAAKDRARRTVCLNNLNEINLGVRMYADDHGDLLTLVSTNHSAYVWTDYKSWMKSYVGLPGASSARDTLFACPADLFHYTGAYAVSYVAQSACSEAHYNYSSYVFNAGNLRSDYPYTNSFPGIAGKKLTSINNPAKTILVAEYPALIPFSWHQRKRLSSGLPGVNDAKSMVSFVDGHVNYSKIFWDPQTTPNRFQAWHYDPPEGYDYQWSGN